MARSAERLGIALATAAVVAAGFAMSGCDTTQDAAARIKIRSARTLASREPVKIRDRAENVEAKATLVGGADGTAVVVELENTGPEAVNDLPILVGALTKDGGKEPLNDGKELPYFQTHTPAIGAGETATWVYAGKDTVGDATDAFAEVGTSPKPPITTASSIPAIDISEPTSSGDGGEVAVKVINNVGIPQFDLAVYVWATDGDRIVAGGFGDAGDLEKDETEPVTVKLVGDAKGADLHASAPPTIFQ